MRIVLLSDTHSHLDSSIFNHLQTADEIWHAGDVGDQNVLNQLSTIRPLRAVYGNIDSPSLRDQLPEDMWLELEGVKFLMTHIGGSPPNYNGRVKKLLQSLKPDVFICGHSHILKVMKDPVYNNMLYINPGAAGNHGFHRMKTIIRFEISSGKIGKLEVIELGKRGAIDSSNE